MLLSRRSILAGTTSAAVLVAAPQISSATGSRKTLRLGTRQIEVDGKAATRYRVTQPSGEIGLTLNQGEEFNVKLENRLPVLSGLHWHGMTEPWRRSCSPASESCGPQGCRWSQNACRGFGVPTSCS
jgi:FtsP/CotA-like multicopper oxidase with cupredoxin domain